jgi:TonB family protein
LLGINLNATYNGTNTYTSTIKANGLVGGDTIDSVTINSQNVVDNATNFITGVTGTPGTVGGATNLLTNYQINSSANGTATTGTPGTTSTNTVTLGAAPLGVVVSGTYNGTKTYVAGGAVTINLAGLVGSDIGGTASSATVNSSNVGSGNYVTGVTPTSGWLASNYVVYGGNEAGSSGTPNGGVYPGTISGGANSGGTNTVTLSKALLGINLNATYNGTNTYTSTIKANGLVGGDTITSVTVSNLNVANNSSNFINGVIGTTGSAGLTSYNFLNNYIINSSANGTATTGTPGTTSTNTVTLGAAPLGISLAATYNGTTTYTTGISSSGLQGTDAITGVTINDSNVASNSANYITGIAGTANLTNYKIFATANTGSTGTNSSGVYSGTISGGANSGGTNKIHLADVISTPVPPATIEPPKVLPPVVILPPQIEIPPLMVRPPQIAQPPVTSVKPAPVANQASQSTNTSTLAPTVDVQSSRPIVNAVTPDYPETALQQGVEGKAFIQLTISPSGEVQSASVSKSSGSADLDTAALNAAKAWVFDASSKAVETLTVPVQFKINKKI